MRFNLFYGRPLVPNEDELLEITTWGSRDLADGPFHYGSNNVLEELQLSITGNNVL